MPNVSYASSPFLVTHSSIEQMNQSGQGRATFLSGKLVDKAVLNKKSAKKDFRKPVTLAESLVHFRQCHLADEQNASDKRNKSYAKTLTIDEQLAEQSSSQDTSSEDSTTSEPSSSNQSTKIFFSMPQS